MKIASVEIPRTALTLLVVDTVTVFLVSGFVFYSLAAVGMVTTSGGLGHYLPHPVAGIGQALLYSILVLITIFAMGLYQRRYLKGRALVQSLGMATILTLVMWLLLDNLILGNTTGFAAFVTQHLLMFTIIAAWRPIVCCYYTHFAGKRRLALIGSKGMIESIRSMADRITPSDFVIVEHHYLDCAHQRDNLNRLIRDMDASDNIDEIAVELHSSQLGAVGQAGKPCPHHPLVRLSSTMSLVEDFARWTDIEMADNVDLPPLPARGYRFFWVKRVIETTLAAAGLIFVLPVLLGTAIAIKLDDGGALFYRQSRVGKNGRVFSVLKFRSMREDAEANGKAQWATTGDSRVTRVGRFLRKSRIDEIPQLMNIVRGDMALVGPRPERPEIVEKLKVAIPGYDKRHVVRPGLTGWAQISYPYGASIEDAVWKTKFDMYYIRNWTILLDMAIIVQTVRVVLFAEGSR